MAAPTMGWTLPHESLITYSAVLWRYFQFVRRVEHVLLHPRVWFKGLILLTVGMTAVQQPWEDYDHAFLTEE